MCAGSTSNGSRMLLEAKVFNLFLFLIFQSTSIVANHELFRPLSYRICVPSAYKSSCHQMITDVRESNGKITCVTGSGMIGCIARVVKNEADFLALEPEEVFIAQKFRKNGFRVLAEIRMEEFKNRDYRYEPVAVIRKSTGINSISDLKGKKSCHTGFGRNAGWKVPFSHLMDKNELPDLCKEIDAPNPERDLFAISNYFSQACAVGQWVPEKDYDAKLRSKYENLCQLCKNPRECNGKDAYAGYDGALKCLTENDGDVAWTKLDAVEKFFKLTNGTPSAIAENYAFLCWDGSSQPLTSRQPCSWAQRPWRAYVASSRLNLKAIEELQKQISVYILQAKQIHETNGTMEWDVKALGINSTSEIAYMYPQHVAMTTTPYGYLRQKNYSVTLEKPSCPTSRVVRICVRNMVTKLKCMDLQLAAIAKRIIPGFDCVLGENSADCFQKVQNGEADVVTASPKEAAMAKMNGLIPILNTLEIIDLSSHESARYKFAVAVIRTDSNIRNLTDLKGKKSCHGSISSLAGWNIPLNVLRKNGIISGPSCGLPIEMAKLFNGSCVPGVFATQAKMPWLPDSLCALCDGDSTPGGAEPSSPGSVCQDGPAEKYFSDVGALQCLEDEVADVAFVDHFVLLHDAKRIIDPTIIRLLCSNGQIMNTADYRHCNWGKVPSTKVLARDGDDLKIERDDFRLSLLKASGSFSPSSQSSALIPLFGPYYSNKNLLFQDSSVGLADDAPLQQASELINEFDFCTTSSGTMKALSTYTIGAALFLPYVFGLVSRNK